MVFLSWVLARVLVLICCFQLALGGTAVSITTAHASSERTDVRVLSEERKCPYCHETGDSTGEGYKFCPSCGTAHHTACAEEAKNCAVDGCRSAFFHAANDVAATSEVSTVLETASRLQQQLHELATLAEAGADAVEIERKRNAALLSMAGILDLLHLAHPKEVPYRLMEYVQNFDGEADLRVYDSRWRSAGIAVLLTVLLFAVPGGLLYSAHSLNLLPAVPDILRISDEAVTTIYVLEAIASLVIFYCLTQPKRDPKAALSLTELSEKGPDKFAVHQTARGLDYLRTQLGDKFGVLPKGNSRLSAWVVQRIHNPQLMCSKALDQGV